MSEIIWVVSLNAFPCVWHITKEEDDPEAIEPCSRQLCAHQM